MSGMKCGTHPFTGFAIQCITVGPGGEIGVDLDVLTPTSHRAGYTAGSVCFVTVVQEYSEIGILMALQ